MGRGNACVFGDYEGLFYVDWDNFSYEFEDERGNVFIDYDAQREEWEMALRQFCEDFMKRFKSFRECDKWLNGDEHAVMENCLFYIAVEDNEWSMAIKLIQKEQEYGDGNIENLQKGLYKMYLEGMKECLFLQFDELGTYGGAWTSRRIRKDEKRSS